MNHLMYLETYILRKLNPTWGRLIITFLILSDEDRIFILAMILNKIHDMRIQLFLSYHVVVSFKFNSHKLRWN